VRDEVITIFMAGHETTAVTIDLSGTCSRSIRVEAKLHAELDAVLGDRAPAADTWRA